MLSVRALAKRYAVPRERIVLANVDLDASRRRIRRDHGRIRRRQVDAAQPDRGPGPARRRHDPARRRRSCALDDDALTRLRRERMGFVFQAFHVLPYLSVAQNVALPLSLLGVPAARGRPRVRRSVGRRRPWPTAARARRASFREASCSASRLRARSSIDPSLVLADEPTGNLDPESAAAVLALLRAQVKERGAAGLLVTHSAAAARTADRVLMLTRDGLREHAVPDAVRNSSYVSDVRAVLKGSLAQNRARTLVAALAIALGVALGFAVQLINESAVDELTQGVRTLSGDADLTVRGPRSGFDEAAVRAPGPRSGHRGGEPGRRSGCAHRGRPEPLRAARHRCVPRRHDPAGARRRSSGSARHAAAGYDLPFERCKRLARCRGRRLR